MENLCVSDSFLCFDIRPYFQPDCVPAKYSSPKKTAAIAVG